MKRPALIATSALVIAILASGCATNHYAKFYTDRTDGLGVAGSPNLILPEKPPIVRQGLDPENDGLAMARNGYTLIGVSSFFSSSSQESGAGKHASRVRADTVLLYYWYKGSESGSRSIPIPTVSTSVTHGQASAYGSGGYAHAHGSATTTTHGTAIAHMPYTVHRYNHLATFWAKLKPLAFGAQFQDLTDDQRRTLQTNRGTVVRFVINGTPAFRNDILEGDIIRKINDTNVTDTHHGTELIAQNRGKPITLTIHRDGKDIQKQLTLDP